MATATNYLEGRICQMLAGVDVTAIISGAYVGLATAVSDAEAGTLTEVTNSNAYARVQISTTQMENTATNGVIANDAAITFPTATGSWGTVTHAFIADSGTHGGGNILSVKALDASKAVGNGDTFEFATGDYTITVT